MTDSSTKVTFYTLVQEALSQLPNGRGNLEDIASLVRQSPYLTQNCDLASLLKKTALALTHFQKGSMQPVCVYDATTQHYIVVPPNKLNNSVPAVKSQISQQKPVKPPQAITQQDHTGNAQSVNAGQSVVVQQRNVSSFFIIPTGCIDFFNFKNRIALKVC